MLPIFKLPVLLYQSGLGWMLGKRFAQITHIGRRSGKAHRTILAVLRFDPNTRSVYAVSAWKGSDWYHNIQASPALKVDIGAEHYTPRQRNLLPEEIADLFIEYREHHPLFARIICRIPGWNPNATRAEFLELARTLRGMVFEPQ
jgi:deazaflavin-dependent oxidoreductase (nitroreductase family)